MFYGASAIARFEALKLAATRRTLTGSDEQLDAAIAKMARKGADVAKCSAIVAIVLKRLPGAKGALMPEWEDLCAVACAVQNLHLQLTAEGYVGYWSSGGVGGWADDEEVRSLVGCETNEPADARDRVLGWFHIGVSDAAARYRAKRGPVASKVTWVLE